MKKLLLAVVLVSLIVVAVVFAQRVSEANARNATPTTTASAMSVRVASARTQDVPESVNITGTIRASSEAAVFGKIPGRIAKVNADVGATVKNGDVLAVIEGNDLPWRVKQAEAQLMAARAGLEQAEVQRKTGTAAFERAQALHKKGSLSQVDLEQAEAGFQLAGVAVKAGQAQVALAEAAVGLATQAFNDSRITAPFSGVVAKRNVDVGTQSSPAQSAFLLQDQSHLELLGTVAATEVGLLKKGMSVDVAVDDLDGQTITGELTYVAPSLDDVSRRAAVKISLKPTPGLLPYMFGRANINFGERKGAVVVPAQAVLPSTDGAIVYVVRNDKVVLVKPTLGIRVGDDVVVEAGISAGDKVVVSGDTGLRDGALVTISAPGGAEQGG